MSSLSLNQTWDSVEHDQKLITSGESHNEFTYQILDKSNLINCLSVNAWKLFNKSEARKWQLQCEQKLIKPGDGNNDFVYQIWGQSDQQFVSNMQEGIRD